MRTFSAALSASLRRDGVDVRHIVGINPNGTEVQFIDGESGAFSLNASVASIKPVTSSIDAFAGTVSGGSRDIVFRADGVARALIADYPLRNKAIRVLLGTTEIVTGEFATMWRGYIDDWSIERNGEVTFSCKDAMGALRDLEITLGVISLHPLEVIRQILLAHVPADLWDADSFDFTQLPLGVTHWNLSRYEAARKNLVDPKYVPKGGSRFRHQQYYGELEGFGGSLLYEPQSAWDIVQDLLTLLGGVVYTNTDGRLAFKRRGSTAVAVRHLTEGDFFDWQQKSGAGNATNRIDVTVSMSEGTDGSDQAFSVGKNLATDRYVRGDDATSQADFSYDGSGIDRVYARTLGSDWLRVASEVAAGISDSATAIDVKSASKLGFSGARYRRGWRGPTPGGTAGGVATTAVSVTSNVATATCAGHWFETGDYITTTGHTTNATSPVAITVVDSSHITYALTAADGALADGVGVLVPEQAPIDQLSSGTREAYLMIVWGERDDQQEIVRATAGAPATGTYLELDARAMAGTGTVNQYSHPHAFTYTIVRGQLGTTARTIPNGACVWDITIPVAMRDERLNRWANGAPEISLKALIRNVDLTVGDVITHDCPSFAMRSIDGANVNVGFEITSISEDEGESPPSVSIEATWIYNSTLPSVTVVPTISAYWQSPVFPFLGPKYSVYFDAASPRFLRAAYSTSMHEVSELAISFWLNADRALNTMSDQAQMCPIGRWQYGQRKWKVVFLSSGQLRFYVASHVSTDAGSNYVGTTTPAVLGNRWAHYLITYISGAVVIYVNGVAVSTSTTGSIGGSFTAGTSRMEIGANGDAANICQGVYVAHPAVFYGAPTIAEQRLFVANPAGGVTGTPGEPGQIDGIDKQISWWPFAHHLYDVLGPNTLAAAGSNAVDPIFSGRYPPL